MRPTRTFSGPLRLEHIGGCRWLVLEAFSFTTYIGWTITVPTSFVTDGASVPRLLWPLYPPFGGDYDEAAVIHDYLYAHAERFIVDGDDRHITRSEADGVMKEAMQAKGLRRSAIFTIYRAVRIGGWLTWRRHRARAGKRRAP